MATNSPQQSHSLSSEAPLRVAVQTLGCRSNYADSIQLQAALLERGAVTCSFDSAADVYVINTCTITDAADRDALRLIRQVRSRAPEARIVVTGCLAESRGERLHELGGVDAVVGLNRRADLLSAVFGNSAARGAASENSPKLRILEGPISREVAGPGGEMGETRTRARYHLRVQDGCRNFCAYCVIPHIKPELSSRPLTEVLADIRHLASLGYNEVVLTGTHLGAYGRERRSSLYELLCAIAGQAPLQRIRLSSLDPNEATAEIVDLIAETDVFCRHLHLSIQSFTDAVLQRMNRRYRLADLRETLCYINQKLPGCCIGADVITGFPGESRQEVDKAIEEFLGLPISYLHVFPYSERAGTAAVSLDGAVAPRERRARAALWRRHGESRRRAFLEGLIGKKLEAVIERVVGGCAYGTSREYAAVCLPMLPEAVSIPGIGAALMVRAAVYDESEKKLVCQSLSPESLA